MRTLVLSFVMMLAPAALADVLPAGSKVISYTYEIANLEQRPDLTIVLWPRSCGSDGSPEGTIDLALNPQYKSHMHDLDYEVVLPGTRHEIGKFCEATARFYGLPAKKFPVEKKVAEADDWRIGRKKGQAYGDVKALDAIPLDKRIAFFRDDRSVQRAALHLDASRLLSRQSRIAGIHDIVYLATGKRGLVLAPRYVVYSYTDGTDEKLPYGSTGNRPAPSHK